MLRVFALPSADQAWALRELDAAAAAAARASERLAELNAARAALCRQPVFVVSAGEVELARGAWCAPRRRSEAACAGSPSSRQTSRAERAR